MLEKETRTRETLLKRKKFSVLSFKGPKWVLNLKDVGKYKMRCSPRAKKVL